MFVFGIVLLVAGALVVVAEIHTLTIYLIALAAACFVAGGLALGADTGLATTLIVFAVVLFAGLPVAYYARRRLKNPESEHVTHDDVGASVTVVTARDGQLRVSYRGAEWDARPAAELAAENIAPGARLRIAARDGNTLVVVGEPRNAIAGA
ncbi:MAG: NfeD family protein [Gammaproteobacteria bacterium]